MPPRTFVDLPPNMDRLGIEGYKYLKSGYSMSSVCFHPLTVWKLSENIKCYTLKKDWDSRKTHWTFTKLIVVKHDLTWQLSFPFFTVISTMFMELEECDYRTATGFTVFGTPTPIDTIYQDEWYELLNAQKSRPSITDKDARKKIWRQYQNVPWCIDCSYFVRWRSLALRWGCTGYGARDADRGRNPRNQNKAS